MLWPGVVLSVWSSSSLSPLPYSVYSGSGTFVLRLCLSTNGLYRNLHIGSREQDRRRSAARRIQARSKRRCPDRKQNQGQQVFQRQGVYRSGQASPSWVISCRCAGLWVISLTAVNGWSTFWVSFTVPSVSYKRFRKASRCVSTYCPYARFEASCLTRIH